MIKTRLCATQGCTDGAASALFDGKRYCGRHYHDAFWIEFKRRWDTWNPNSNPSPEVRSILGRMYEEFYRVEGDSYLSKARIRDRGFDFKKTTDGCLFSITRHLNAWRATHKMHLVVERWGVTFDKQVFKLLGQREWKQGDPD